VLPPDGHVHTEWSWDAQDGSMERACARAAGLGLPSVAFTDHADFTRWVTGPGEPLSVPPLDVPGYLAGVQRCRDLFPELRIRSGAELGEPHWHPDQVTALLAAGSFDRVLGSVHSLAADGIRMVDGELFERLGPDELMRAYLAETLRLADSAAPFAVLAHLDYAVRYWPAAAGPFDPARFEDEFRAVLGALARSGRALELNTRVPLAARIIRWWHEAGGAALAFGSDAHEPALVADGFAAAADVAAAAGFRPGRDPHDFWLRHPPRRAGGPGAPSGRTTTGRACIQ
jgi:histidinol-phosphatase (PHP family)